MFLMSNKVLFLRAGSYPLSHSRFPPLFAVPWVHSVGLLPSKRRLKLSPVLNLTNVRKKENLYF